MAENRAYTRPPRTPKPRRYRVDEGPIVRFFRHANSTHVSQTLWRGLTMPNCQKYEEWLKSKGCGEEG